MEQNQDEFLTQEYLIELRRGNDLTAELIKIQRDWRFALRNGLLGGLGGVLGATVLVSLLVWILQPLKQLEFLKPSLDKIGQELERRPVKNR
jgi:hypothetical protein